MESKSSKYCRPYLPDLLINSVIRDSATNKSPVIEGGLLFADLSGFTAMSEKLAVLGRLGAEKLAEIINDCFNSLLGIVFACDGDIIKFGGDAFLAYFGGPDSSLKAYRCASGLIKWISDNGRIATPVGEFLLGIHVGISEGKIFNLFIGDHRREHLFNGEAVEKCYAACETAQLGELAVTDDMFAGLIISGGEPAGDGYYIFRKFKGIDDMKTAARPNIDIEDCGSLNAFLIKGLEPKLRSNNGYADGEHRVLTSLFIAIDSLRKNLEADLHGSMSSINRYFNMLNGIIEKYGGSFARLDSTGTSEKMLAFFGAPVSSGYDARNCLKAVLEIAATLNDMNSNFVHPLRHRYGINTGLCFVGDVGGESRREYTAMGDAINLAARFMDKAGYGEILVGEDTLKVCGDSFIVREGDLIRIKGKIQPVRLQYLEKEIEPEISTALIIGREKELAQAKDFIGRIKDGKQAALMISGEPGAGKSLLSGKIKDMAASAGLRCIEGDCFKYSEKTPYGPLKTILELILGLNTRSTQKHKKDALAKAIKAIGESEWLPLFAPLLDYYPPAPPYLSNLPEDIKKQKIKDILIGLICKVNEREKFLIIVEDIQWIDDTSLNIIMSLLDNPDRPGILFICRPGDIFDKLKNLPDIESIELAGLAYENSRRLFLAVLGGGTPGEDTIKQVIDKSAGNPFYLEEMAKAFKELGPDKFADNENIPTGIESVITARIDNLGETLKKTVRTASVIGRVFAYNVLKNILPDQNLRPRLRKYLGELAHLDLTPLERTQPVLEYIFKHILTQEVAYNGLSFSLRQALHLKTAEYYAARKRSVKRQPEVAGRHYLLAGKPEKALPFLYLAGRKAAAEFANAEAFDFYNKVIDIAGKLDDEEYLTKAIRDRGELAKLVGDFSLAESDYRRLKQLAGSDTKLKGEALRKLSEIHRLTAAYDKAGSVIDELEKLLPGDIPTKVFCLNGRGEISRRGGKLQEARKIFLEANKLCDYHDIPLKLKAGVYNNLGVCHWGLGRLRESAEYYRAAQKLYREIRDLSGQAKVTNNLGIISDEMGKLGQAARSYEKAERIFKRIGAARMQAFACANLGTNFHTRGYLGKAEEKLKDARRIFEKIGDKHSLAYAIGDLGFLYHRIGDLESAEKYLKDAYKRARMIKDEEFILETEVRLMRLGHFRGDILDLNEDNLVKKADKIGSSELRIKTLILKGMAQIRKRDYEGAEHTIGAAKSIEEIKDHPELAVDLAKLELIYAVINDEFNKANRIAVSSFKKAIAGNLAMTALELYILADIFSLDVKADKKLTAKIRIFFDRMQNSISPNQAERLVICHRRKVEVLKNFISSFPRKLPGGRRCAVRS